MEREHETQTDISPQALKWELTALLDKLAVVAGEEHQQDIADVEQRLTAVIDDLKADDHSVDVGELSPFAPSRQRIDAVVGWLTIILALILGGLTSWVITRSQSILPSVILMLALVLFGLAITFSLTLSRRS